MLGRSQEDEGVLHKSVEEQDTTCMQAGGAPREQFVNQIIIAESCASGLLTGLGEMSVRLIANELHCASLSW